MCIFVPPSRYFFRVRPRQAKILVERDIVIVRVVVRTCVNVLGRFSIEIDGLGSLTNPVETARP